ncbi:putative peroxin 20 [Golovinomyces cichoracearum]|uniref:Putative peroxin 20 n=1 Tax=Golovinomyces cichoracearum TaxID=62708 RepID=A0A420IR81_9PEZI|nr:putative peroxin 20 [Golovinomyces cichoracearum]
MAGGMCGPSNPLQNLQKQSSIDRTLQQDRYISRQLFSNGFRLSQGPSSEVVEAEFKEFQNASLPIDHALPSFEISKNISDLQHSQNSNWVSDFMNLNFSTSSSTSTQQITLPPEYPPVQQEAFNYGHTIKRQQIQKSNMAHLSNMHEVNNMSIFDTSNPVPPTNEIGDKLKHHSNQLLESQAFFEEKYDQEAFARAFKQVAELEKNEVQDTHQEPASLEQESLSKNRFVDSSPILDDVHLTQAPIGADAIEYENFYEEHDSSSLSRTASKLLKSVDDDQSLKFQNSQFLELMRQFRDKNATIKGNKIVSEKLEAHDRK